MNPSVDLHIHTYFSDGINSPEEVLEIVRNRNLTAFSICDHDNIGGYLQLKGQLGRNDPELVPGVELSSGYGGEDIHILGYYFDLSSDELNNELLSFRNRRNQRGAEMLNKLKGMGIDIPLDLVKELAGRSAIGRPNVADALVGIKAVSSFAEAFEKYIGYNCPAYIPKENMTPREAIELIHRAGGLAVLAHPGIADAGSHIDEYLEYGLDGIEVYHPMHNNRIQQRYAKLAESKNILATGGSDFHGRQEKYGKIGQVLVSEDLPAIMQNRLSLMNRG
jgi:predicted metal-dependent phosphoesterase TrpH